MSSSSAPQNFPDHGQQLDISDSNDAEGDQLTPPPLDTQMNGSASSIVCSSLGSVNPASAGPRSTDHDQISQSALAEQIALAYIQVESSRARHAFAASQLEETKARIKQRRARIEKIEAKITGTRRDIEEWERAGIRVHDEEEDGENWQIQEYLGQLPPLQESLNTLYMDRHRFVTEMVRVKLDGEQTWKNIQVMEQEMERLKSGK